MSNVSGNIGFSLISLEDFEDELFAQQVIDALLSAPESLRPKTYSVLEEDKKIITIDELIYALLKPKDETVDVKTVTLLLKYENHCGYQISWDKLHEPGFQLVSGRCQIDLLKQQPHIFIDFCALIKKLIKIVKPVYGYLQNDTLKGSFAAFNLTSRLPDPRHVSILGAPYVELFGRAAIESAPFEYIEEIAPGYYWLQANESVFDPVPEAKKRAIREHFGEDAFGRKLKGKPSRVPKFDFRNTLISSDIA
jgi:hypothetical protein